MSEFDVKRKVDDLFKKAKQNAKPTKCILCGNEQTSFCNSHSIPKSVLKNIATQGMVLQPSVAMNLEEIPIFDDEIGVNKTGTFHLICDKCDRLFFREYENVEENLLGKLSDSLLAEIAVKNVIQMIYKRGVEIELEKLMKQHPTYRGNYLPAIYTKFLDLKEYHEDLKIYKSIIEGNEQSQFKIMLHEVLPYRVPIAAQTMIALMTDLEGREINDIHADSSKRIQSLHVCVFPLKEKSVVLAFYHIRNKNYRMLLHQLNSLSQSKRLVYINYLVFNYTENLFFSKTIADSINDSQALKELSRGGISALLTNEERENDVHPEDIPNFLDKEYAITDF